MAVIIRLQNLPLTANTLDIREFFKGLCIPDGGVHIVGGEFGDAFIGFATDEDARQAMNMTSKKIKDARVKLLLSSRNEMQNVILAARERQAKLLLAAASLNPGSVNGSAQNMPNPLKSNNNDPDVGEGNRRRSKSSDRSGGDRRSKHTSTFGKPSRSKSRSRDRSDRTRDRRRSRTRSKSTDRKRVQHVKDSTYDNAPPIRTDPRTVHRRINAQPENDQYSDREKVGYTTASRYQIDQHELESSGMVKNLSQTLSSSSLPMPLGITPATKSSNSSGLAPTFPLNNISSANFNWNFPLPNASMMNPAAPHILNTLNMPFQTSLPNPNIANSLNPPPLPFFMPQCANLSAPLPMPNYNQPFVNNTIQSRTFDVSTMIPNPNFVTINNMSLKSYTTNSLPHPDHGNFSGMGNGINKIMSHSSFFVEVRNIPVEFRFGDIENFFSGCDLWEDQDGIIEVLGPRSESTDKVIIKLQSESGYKNALAKNGQRLPNFKNRVEILPSSEERWSGEKSRLSSSTMDTPRVDDVHDMSFNNKFNVPRDVSEAYQRGDRYRGPSAYNSLPDEDIQQKSPRINNMLPPPVNAYHSSDGFCVRLRNLAYEADSKDVQRFFRDLPILNLHIETNDAGKRTGMAYVEFADKRDLDTALEQHKMKILERSVLIESIPKAEVVEIVRQNLATLTNRNNAAAPFSTHSRSMPLVTNNMNRVGFISVHVGCLPYTFTVKDLGAMFTSHDINPKAILILTDHGKNVGQAFVELHSLMDMNAAISRLNNLRIGTHNVIKVVSSLNPHEIKRHLRQFDPIDWPKEQSINTYGNFQKIMPRGSAPMGNPNFSSGNVLTPPIIPSHNSRFGPNSGMSLGPHGQRMCKVKIRNLPEDASADDIIDLFKPFHCIPHTLQVIHIDGKPVGEATLGFPNPQACTRVLDAMNGKAYKKKQLSLALLV